MKAITINNFCEIEHLQFTEVPKPKPNDDEVLIETAYVGVNPVDWKICEGYLKKLLPHAFPLIPGWDVSGTIVEVGKNVADLKVGDEVYAFCRKPVVQWGTYAEYVAFTAEHVALKPRSLTLAQAAAIPLVGLTAWQSLFDTAHLSKGQTVLIHAGAGGVGSIAISLAKHAGATIYTTAGERNHDYVKSLGADVAIDYLREDFVKCVPKDLDMVFDCAGYGTLEKSYPLVKKGGHLVSIVNHPDEKLAEKYGIQATFVLVRPDGEELRKIADLLDEGKIKPPAIREKPLEKIVVVLKCLQEGHTRGKVVMKMQYAHNGSPLEPSRQ